MDGEPSRRGDLAGVRRVRAAEAARWELDELGADLDREFDDPLDGPLRELATVDAKGTGAHAILPPTIRAITRTA